MLPDNKLHILLWNNNFVLYIKMKVIYFFFCRIQKHKIKALVEQITFGKMFVSKMWMILGKCLFISYLFSELNEPILIQYLSIFVAITRVLH